MGKSKDASASADPYQQLDLPTLGARIRHARTDRNLTLVDLSRRVGRAPSLLSQIENGKREPKVSILSAIASVLEVPVEELMKPEPPSERTALELELKAAQTDPAFANIQLPSVHVGPRLPMDALRALVASYRQLRENMVSHQQTPEAARAANLLLREEMSKCNNYLPEIENIAAAITKAVGHEAGPLLESGVEEIAAYLGFTLVRVDDLPQAARSVTDLHSRRIYLPIASRGDKDPRQVILRALGDQALGHEVPHSFYDFLRQRVRSNYFASAVLMPEKSTLATLRKAKKNRDIAMSDLRDMAAVRYETAVLRFTNLATEHLGLQVHFLRVGEDGVIYKAYENDGVVFPTDLSGAVEGQLACRQFAARRVFNASDRYGPYPQYTDTPQGTYWEVAQVERYRAGEFAISVGVPFDQATFFRGRETTVRAASACPDVSCCREPSAELYQRWGNYAWPSVRVHSHLLAAVPPGSFPGLDDREVYEFLEKHS